MKYERIPFPTEEEQRASIDQIVRLGLSRRPSLLSCLKNLWHAAGLRGILHGVWDCFFLSLLLSGLTFCLLLSGSAALTMPSSSWVLAAPLCYALLFELTRWKERQMGTEEIKMACRYTLRHLTAFRLLLAGVVSIAFQLLGLYAAFLLSPGFAFLRLFLLSACAMSLYGGLQLAFLVRCRHRLLRSAGAPCLWLACCFAAAVFPQAGAGLERLTQAAPSPVLCAALLLSTLFYLSQIRVWFLTRQEGDTAYAFR